MGHTAMALLWQGCVPSLLQPPFWPEPPFLSQSYNQSTHLQAQGGCLAAKGAVGGVDLGFLFNAGAHCSLWRWRLLYSPDGNG